MTQEIHEPPVSPSIQSVLDLFDNELSQLKFPDVDKSVLAEAAHSVYQHAEALARAEAALSAAREVLQESQEALLQKCHRAVAYARVYAEENTVLAHKLEDISLPRGSRRSGAAPSATHEARPQARRAPRQKGQRPLFLESSAEPNLEPLAVESQAA